MKATTAIVLVLAAGAAQAQSEPPGGWYGAVNLGQARVHVDRLTDNRNTSFGVDLGYRLNRSFALEGSFVRLGSFEPSYDVRALSIAGIGFLPIEDAFSLYGKAGIASTHVEAGHVTPNATGLVLGAGLRYDITPRWFAKAGWDRYSRVGDEAVGRGSADVVTLGVGLQFR
jgi:OOP family OmpA-OmpF porin